MNKKVLIIILIMVAVLIVATMYIVCTDSNSEDNQIFNPEIPVIESVEGHIVVAVQHLDGRMIIPGTHFPYVDGETAYTAYSALRLAATLSSYSGMQSIVTRGSGRMLYVSAMAGLSERERGPASGWVFEVNGERIGISAGVFELSEGDVVLWRYTVDGR